MRIFAIAALALTVAATPAFAQSEDKPFSGFHIEAIGGIDAVSAGGENETGLVFGGAAGFDIQSSKVVIGADVEGTMGTAKWCTSGVCVETGRDLYAGARVGLPIGQQGLVYIRGGYTNARAKITTGGTTVFTQDLDGVRGGIGIEGRKGMLLVRAEYRYSNYEQDFERHQLVLGVGVHF
ncbi:MAG: outer membrane beta-barrel protein [Pseudomonadota bacterium]